MNLKKCLLTILVAFSAFFIIGNIKVKASADYIACYYTVSKSQLQVDRGWYNDDAKQDMKIGVLYNASSGSTNTYAGGFTNNPFSKGRTGWYYITKKEFEKFLISNSPNWNGKDCPKIDVAQYLIKDGGGEGGSRFYKLRDKAQGVSGKRYFYGKNMEDKTCNYYDEDTKKQIEVVFSYGGSPHILHFSRVDGKDRSWNNNNGYPVFGVKVDGKQYNEMRWLTVDGDDNLHEDERSVSYRTFDMLGELDTNGECPLWAYYGTADGESNYYFSEKGDYNYSPKYQLMCDMGDNEEEYQAMKAFFEANFDGNKVTADPLDKAFGEELSGYLEKYNSLIEEHNKSNAQKVSCFSTDTESGISLETAAEKLCKACLEKEECTTKVVKEHCEEVEENNAQLDNITQVLRLPTTTFKGITYDPKAEFNCGIFGDKDDEKSLMYVIVRIFTWIRIAVPILVVVLGCVDFAKVIVSQDQDMMKKATSTFTKRCIMALIVFFIPSILILILGWIDKYIIDTKDCISGNLGFIINYIKYMR